MQPLSKLPVPEPSLLRDLLLLARIPTARSGDSSPSAVPSVNSGRPGAGIQPLPVSPGIRTPERPPKDLHTHSPASCTAQLLSPPPCLCPSPVDSSKRLTANLKPGSCPPGLPPLPAIVPHSEAAPIQCSSPRSTFGSDLFPTGEEVPPGRGLLDIQFTLLPRALFSRVGPQGCVCCVKLCDWLCARILTARCTRKPLARVLLCIPCSW